MGIQQMLLAVGGIAQASIVVGQNGVFFGYSSTGPTGSITPSNFGCSLQPTYYIIGAGSTTSPNCDFVLSLYNGSSYAGSQTGYFNTVYVYDQTNTLRSYTAASAATFTASSGQWTWGTGSNKVFTATGVNRQIYFS